MGGLKKYKRNNIVIVNNCLISLLFVTFIYFVDWGKTLVFTRDSECFLAENRRHRESLL